MHELSRTEILFFSRYLFIIIFLQHAEIVAEWKWKVSNSAIKNENVQNTLINANYRIQKYIIKCQIEEWWWIFCTKIRNGKQFVRSIFRRIVLTRKSNSENAILSKSASWFETSSFSTSLLATQQKIKKLKYSNDHTP